MITAIRKERTRESRGLFLRTFGVTAISAPLMAMAPASAHEIANGVDADVEYTAGYIAPLSGAERQQGVALDNLLATFDVDLEKIANFGGTQLYFSVLSNDGGTPNNNVGSAQGVDNIEVADQGLRLYEFWIEKSFGRSSIRAGLYDLNSEFYANDSAGMLIAPAFGIGSELAATGNNGPSIFPSTALGLRLRLPVTDNVDVKVAAINADAGVLGDPGGVDFSFEDGMLLIGEVAWNGSTHASFGAWTYTNKQDDIRNAGERANAFGAYLTLERRLIDFETDRSLSGFVRLGFSDGDTTSYAGGWQTGVLFQNPFTSRPENWLSLGVYQGVFDDKQRANQRDAGVDAARAETGVELTYSDQVTPWLRLQPDLQMVLDPNGDAARDDAWVAGLRLAITPWGSSES